MNKIVPPVASSIRSNHAVLLQHFVSLKGYTVQGATRPWSGNPASIVSNPPGGSQPPGG